MLTTRMTSAKRIYSTAITGTKMLLTFAMRLMPPKTQAVERTTRTSPISHGCMPKAPCMAPQMVLLWMEM